MDNPENPIVYGDELGATEAKEFAYRFRQLSEQAWRQGRKVEATRYMSMAFSAALAYLIAHETGHPVTFDPFAGRIEELSEADIPEDLRNFLKNWTDD